MNKIIERKDFNWTVLKVANILCDRTVYASWKCLKGLLKPCTYYIAVRCVTTVYASWKRLKGLLKPCTYELYS